MIRSLSRFFVTLVQKYLPDPFLFAVVLTLIVFIMGIVIAGNTPMQMVLHWGNGFWNLLAFSMQMALVLVTGHTLANSPFFKRVLTAIAKIPKNPWQAVLINTFVALIAAWINWGFGLVIGALLARYMAKEVKGLDYGLIIASGYIGFLVWHAGLSGSVQLTIATKGHFLEKTIGIIPTSETIFAPHNLIIFIVILITLPFVVAAMNPRKEDVVEIDPKLLEEEEYVPIPKEKMTPADKLENSPVLSLIIGIIGMVYIIWYFTTKGFALNLNIVNFTFLFLGILLHGTPKRFLIALAEAARGAGGIILQFPFYSGIMGMMMGSGLAAIISNWFVSISTPTTFPLFTFLSAGVVNLFVPSGGGQWAVQGPIMVPAGQALGVSIAKVANSVAWGDAWTNMIQPFWALPALGIAGLGARDIMGYCLVAMLYSGIIIGLGLMLL